MQLEDEDAQQTRASNEKKNGFFFLTSKLKYISDD